jgi:thioredoxin reductase
MLDVIVVGGGPAGLSAALHLARARRTVLLLDAGKPRNDAATHVNGLVGMDGIPPSEFRAAARKDLEKYPCVTVRDEWVDEVTPVDEGFEVRIGQTVERARRVILATGIVDVLPDLPHIDEFWGRSAMQCPFCHGWEVAEGALGFLARSADELSASHLFEVWSSRVAVFTDGAFEVPQEAREDLARRGIELHDRPVADLRGSGGVLEAVLLDDGTEVPCDALFMHNEQRHTDLVSGLGLDLDEDEFIEVPKNYHGEDTALPLLETSTPGLYAAGDLTGRAQDAVIAAFEGTMAARKAFFDQVGRG